MTQKAPGKGPKKAQIVGFAMLAVGVVVRVGGEFAGSWLMLAGFVIWAAGRAVEWYRRD